MGIVKQLIQACSKIINVPAKTNIAPYYHLVSNEKLSHIKHLYSYKNEVEFEEDLKYLQKYYQAVSPNEIIDNFHLKHQKKYILSFDDGLIENYTVILPLLEKYKIKAVFFINPSFVGNNHFLNKHLKSILIEELKKTSQNHIIWDKIRVKKNENLKTAIFNRELSNNFIFDLFDCIPFDFKNYIQHQPVYMNLNQIQELLDKGHFLGGHTMTHPYLNKLSEGFKFAIRSNLKSVLPLIKPRLKKYNFNGLDYIINIWFNFYHTFSKKNLRKRIPKDISVEYQSEIDSETSNFIKKNQENDIFRKSSDFFNWIKKYPWILPAPLHQFSKKEQYEFSMFSEEKFDYSFLKITQNNKIIGFTVLQQRDYSGKILFSYFDKKSSKVISDIILLHFLNAKVRDFICYERFICDCLEAKKFLFIYKKQKSKARYYLQIF